MNEAHLLRSRHLACGRCHEEVARAAEWCPHCGFDLSHGGGVETRRSSRRPLHTVFENARLRLTIGTIAAAVVLIAFLIVSTMNLNDAVTMVGFAFVIAIWVIGTDLSVRALLYMSPTVAATFTVLSLSK